MVSKGIFFLLTFHYWPLLSSRILELCEASGNSFLAANFANEETDPMRAVVLKVMQFMGASLMIKIPAKGWFMWWGRVQGTGKFI